MGIRVTRSAYDNRVEVVVVRLTRWLGFSVKPVPDGLGHMCLCFCAWYPRGWRRLGYAYGAVRWFRRKEGK